MRGSLVLAAVLLLAEGSLGAGERLTVQAPTVMVAPGHLVVEARVEPDPSNKRIQVIAESPQLYRSSEAELAGSTAPRTTTFEFRDLPPGTYAVRAQLPGQKRRPVTLGTLPTDSAAFGILLASTAVIVGGLSYFPVLALGPVLEHLSLGG